MVNAFVIVWRESLEAMLVIGILSAWVNGRGGTARPALWGGVLAGIGLALALALQPWWPRRAPSATAPARHTA